MIARDYGISDSASSRIVVIVQHSWMTSSSLWGNQTLKRSSQKRPENSRTGSVINNKERPIVQG